MRLHDRDWALLAKALGPWVQELVTEAVARQLQAQGLTKSSPPVTIKPRYRVRGIFQHDTLYRPGDAVVVGTEPWICMADCVAVSPVDDRLGRWWRRPE